MSYPHAKLINKLQEYAKAKDTLLPFDTLHSVSNGLVSLGLYSFRTQNPDKFTAYLQHVLSWNVTKPLPDRDIEEFIQHIGPQNPDIIATPEFSATYVFNRVSLQELLMSLARPHKMLRLNVLRHAVGIYLQGSECILIDPVASDVMHVSFSSLAAASDAAFASLAQFCNDDTDLAINVSISDIEHVAKVDYSAANEMLAKWKQTQSIQRRFLQHPQIFSLLCLCHDHAGIDELCAGGFKWDANDKEQNNELIFAVNRRDKRTIEYLTTHIIAIDTMSGMNITALGRAIKKHDDAMLLYLLSLGANPQLEVVPGYAPVYYALLWENIPAVMILLACGARIQPDDLARLKRDCTYDNEYLDLLKHIFILNARLFNLQEPLHIEHASSEQMAGMLIRLNLAEQLGVSLDHFTVKHRNQFVKGQDIRYVLTEHLDEAVQDEQTDLMHYLANFEIHHLLSSGVTDQYAYLECIRVIRDLSQNLESIFANPDQKLTDRQLLALREIETIMRLILAEYSKGTNPANHLILYQVQNLQKTMDEYWQRGGFANLQAYILQQRPSLLNKAKGLFFSTPEHMALPDFPNAIAPLIAKWQAAKFASITAPSK